MRASWRRMWDAAMGRADRLPADDPAPFASSPDNVLTIDGHWWEFLGHEDASTWRPQDRMYARAIWRCQRCHAESRVYANSPKIWTVVDGHGRPAGRSSINLDDPADAQFWHVAMVCPGHPS